MENYELCITDTDFCGFVSTDILIHTYGFLFFLVSNILCLNVRVSFCIVNYFPYISFFNFALKGHHLLFFPSSVPDSI